MFSMVRSQKHAIQLPHLTYGSNLSFPLLLCLIHRIALTQCNYNLRHPALGDEGAYVFPALIECVPGLGYGALFRRCGTGIRVV